MDLNLSLVKPLSVTWIIKVIEHISTHPHEVQLGFKQAGILEMYTLINQTELVLY